MKVKDLTKYLSEMDPEDDICALVYDKRQFDFPDDEDLYLDKVGWQAVCDDFDEQAWADIWTWLTDGAFAYAVTRRD